jgi:transketolase
VAAEAGVTAAWGHYVGPAGAVVGLDRFGASGPYKTVYQGFGITAEAIVARAKGLLA